MDEIFSAFYETPYSNEWRDRKRIWSSAGNAATLGLEVHDAFSSVDDKCKRTHKDMAILCRMMKEVHAHISHLEECITALDAKVEQLDDKVEAYHHEVGGPVYCAAKASFEKSTMAAAAPRSQSPPPAHTVDSALLP